MALILTKEMNSGVRYDYHKIGRVIVDRMAATVIFDVLSFLDKATKEAGRDPVKAESFQIGFDDDWAAILPNLYGYVKTLAHFEGALDDL